jgi:hypothetical protein
LSFCLKILPPVSSLNIQLPIPTPAPPLLLGIIPRITLGTHPLFPPTPVEVFNLLLPQILVLGCASLRLAGQLVHLPLTNTCSRTPRNKLVSTTGKYSGSSLLVPRLEELIPLNSSGTGSLMPLLPLFKKDLLIFLPAIAQIVMPGTARVF